MNGTYAYSFVLLTEISQNTLKWQYTFEHICSCENRNCSQINKRGSPDKVRGSGKNFRKLINGGGGTFIRHQRVRVLVSSCGMMTTIQHSMMIF